MALPTCTALHLSRAEQLELGGDMDGARAAYENLVATAPSALAYVHYMRFVRRVDGAAAARKAFGRCRKDPGVAADTVHITYIAAAHIEYFLNKESRIARNVFELGAFVPLPSLSFVGRPRLVSLRGRSQHLDALWLLFFPPGSLGCLARSSRTVFCGHCGCLRGFGERPCIMHSCWWGVVVGVVVGCVFVYSLLRFAFTFKFALAASTAPSARLADGLGTIRQGLVLLVPAPCLPESGWSASSADCVACRIDAEFGLALFAPLVLLVLFLFANRPIRCVCGRELVSCVRWLFFGGDVLFLRLIRVVCSGTFCVHALPPSPLGTLCVCVGLKKFPECVDFALEYIDFLWNQNDSEYLKVTFERILKSLPAQVRLTGATIDGPHLDGFTPLHIVSPQGSLGLMP